MSKPTKEQIVQWLKSIRSPYAGFTVNAIADLDASIKHLSARLDIVTHERNNLLETCDGLDKTIAEQVAEIERLNGIIYNELQYQAWMEINHSHGVGQLRQQLDESDKLVIELLKVLTKFKHANSDDDLVAAMDAANTLLKENLRG